MAKRKQERALFELLSQQRGRQKARPDAESREAGAGGAETPSAPSPPGRESGAGPAGPPRRPAPTVVTREAVLSVGGIQLSAYHLVIVGVVILCLCYLFFLLGSQFGGPDDGLPDVPAEPTAEQIQNQPPEKGLVGPGPAPPPLGRRVEREPEPKPKPAPQPPQGRAERQGEAAGADEDDRPLPRPARKPEPQPQPTGPQYRVRIARLDVSRPDAIDALRAYLARSGIETDLVTRGGYHVLYSRRRFNDKAKADALATQVNKSLAAFEAETGRPTSKDAYTVQAKRE